MTTVSRRSRPTVVVVGAGAAGALTAIHLARGAGRRSTDIDIVLVDPSDRIGRGVAYSTDDEQHLLNVQAAGMSALPEDPSHFVDWRTRDNPVAPGSSDTASDPAAFASRRQFGRYLDETLRDAVEAANGAAGIRQLRARAVAVRRTATGVAVQTSDGNELTAEATVIAVGLPSPGTRWAPDALQASAFFVPDPWAPGALDVVRRDRSGPPDVLLVGTGLTTVDVALSLSDASSRPDRVIHAISRGGRLPAEHRPEIRLAAIPDISDWGHDLAGIRRHARRHLASVARSTGDWRPGVDGLRFQVSSLWERLSEPDRAEFMTRYATRWSSVRHRMAPASAVVLRELRAAGRLVVGSAEVAAAEPLPTGGLRVTLADGSTRDVGWVVNCTGPQTDVRALGNPLLDDLLRSRSGSALAVVSTAGLGFETHHGRLLGSDGASDAPIWTLGAMRRGELWESTAVPELRSQAFALAQAVLDDVAPLPRQLADGRVVGGRHPVARPRDPLGMPLSTTAEAAAHYNAGIEKLMRLQNGGDELIRHASELDPDFALAHAAMAMLGHEAGVSCDVQASLDAAR
ncbi:MAG TPA: FAD/NAD(P)-binding protein, partial [Nocardioidaceae bacterium]|nr:FAD/NAD(P)-binding protein [Nocardioidaceae bacterium]